MVRTAKRPATYEDLLALPDNVVGEIVDGELWSNPRPATRHTRASSRLGGLLFGPFDHGRGGPGGWLILDEPELHLGRDVLVPDLAGWRRERMPVLPDAPSINLAPDWVCEVLSPSTETLDRGRKLAAYRRHRVPHLWLVNPLAETLEVLHLEGERYSLLDTFTGEAEVRAEPFDAVPLPLALLWQR